MARTVQTDYFDGYAPSANTVAELATKGGYAGLRAWVFSANRAFVCDPNSTAAVDGIVVLACASGGRWIDEALVQATSLEAKLRARADAILGANATFVFDEFEYIAAGMAALWNPNAGVAISTAYPTAISVTGAAGDVVYRRQVLNLRTDKWFVGGVFKISGAIGAGSQKGFRLDNNDATGALQDGVLLGVCQAQSATKFSAASFIASAKTVGAASTIDYDANAHVFYMWSDTTQVKFSVDFEAEILVTSTMTNLANGALCWQSCGVFAAPASNVGQIGSAALGRPFAA